MNVGTYLVHQTYTHCNIPLHEDLNEIDAVQYYCRMLIEHTIFKNKRDRIL